MQLRADDQHQTTGDDAVESRVLASALSEGHEVEVVEFGDGSVGVRFDGAIPRPYRWAPAQLDACMNLYLRLLRR
jgi:hypothetical protein